MRLIEIPGQVGVDDLPKLVEFSSDRIPPYAILSHRWHPLPSEEIAFSDLIQQNQNTIGSLRKKPGYQKLWHSCEQTRKHGLAYLWIDTCCIDKSSSAELSEAINSMHAWYSKSQVCFAYLADVPSTVDLTSSSSEFIRTEWATRGWTLQELLAPSHIIFYSSSWHEIGTKASLSRLLSVMTGIDEEYLVEEEPNHVMSASIAKRMSWAARRITSRPEDIAYCLMGIFQVNMPMLYGEGEKAFIRLQEEIMKHSDDHSLFAWTDEGQDDGISHGLLAKHPRCFKSSGNIMPYEDRESRAPFSLSNRGLRIELHLTKLDDSLFAAALDCPVPPAYDDSSFLAIYLKKLPFSQDQYGRVKVQRFCKTYERGRLQTIYVRQTIIAPDIGGLFPTHVLQLRSFVTNNTGYHVAQTFFHDDVAAKAAPQAVKTTQSTKAWMPNGYQTTCKITSKGDVRALFGVQIIFEEWESIILVLGTANLQIGFNAALKDSPNLTFEQQRELFDAQFDPLQIGSWEVVGYHRICVTAEPLVSRGAKYYMVDIQLEALPRPRNVVEEVLDAVEDFVTSTPRPPTQSRPTITQRLKRPFGTRWTG